MSYRRRRKEPSSILSYWGTAGHVPNAVLTDQETQADPEIYSVAEASRDCLRNWEIRDGQLEQDEEKRSFWNYTAGLRPQKTIRRFCARFMDAAFSFTSSRAFPMR